jgi:GGDEF domain-containing protein
VAVGGEAVRVGASIGIAYGTPGRVGSGELLRNADIAMYSAKLGGRNRTVVFAPDLASGAAKPA